MKTLLPLSSLIRLELTINPRFPLTVAGAGQEAPGYSSGQVRLLLFKNPWL